MSDIFYEVLMEKRAGKIGDFFSRINPFSRRAALSDAVADARADHANQLAERAEAVMMPRSSRPLLEYESDLGQEQLLAAERAAYAGNARYREEALRRAEEAQLPVLAKRRDIEHKRGYDSAAKSNLKRNLLIGSGLLAAGGGAYAYDRNRKKRNRKG